MFIRHFLPLHILSNVSDKQQSRALVTLMSKRIMVSRSRPDGFGVKGFLIPLSLPPPPLPPPPASQYLHLGFPSLADKFCQELARFWSATVAD